VDGGMLWRNGCDGKVLRCGAGNRHQQGARIILRTVVLILISVSRATVVTAGRSQGNFIPKFFQV
jgi:hypothetical protein